MEKREIELPAWVKGISSTIYIFKDKIPGIYELFKDSEQSEQSEQKLRDSLIKESKKLNKRDQIKIIEENLNMDQIFDQFGQIDQNDQF